MSQAARAWPLLLAVGVFTACGGSALDGAGRDTEDGTTTLDTLDTLDTIDPEDLSDAVDVDMDGDDGDLDAAEDTDLDDTTEVDTIVPSDSAVPIDDTAGGAECLGQSDGTDCDDRNACTSASECQAGRCVATAGLSCDDGEPCTDDSCDIVLGCVHSPNLGQCDDGDHCSTNDFCRGGVCIAGAAKCDDGNPCTRNDCDAAGLCDFVADDALPCQDASACTAGDYCAGGFCIGGALDGCEAASTTCVVATCSDDGLTCNEVPQDDAPCEDGNACTDSDRCAAGACVSGGAIDCGWDPGCADFMCDPIDGCVLRSLFLANTPCDDDDRCTLDTVCDAGGRCQGGDSLVCDDRNDCTVDTCEAARGCVMTSTNGAVCDDNNACTSTDLCVGSFCRGDAVDCDDGDPCTLDRCDPLTGCVSSPLICESTNPCEVGVCTEVGGCGYIPRVGACDDGLACTTGDQCVGSQCRGTTTCDDLNACTLDVCDQEEGCVFVPFEGPCDDGDPCTVGETCAGDGLCGDSQTLPVVDDGVECTLDLCSAEPFGTHVSDATLCGDGQGCSPTADCVDASTDLTFELVLLTSGSPDGDAFALVVTSRNDASFELEGYTIRLDDGSSGVLSGLAGVASVPITPGSPVALIHRDSASSEVYAAIDPDIVIVGVFGTADDGMRWQGLGDVLTVLSPDERVLISIADDTEN